MVGNTETGMTRVPSRQPKHSTLEHHPVWSPDGKRIAYGRYPFSGEETLTIQVLDLQTKKITVLPASEGLFSPRWSPDGRYLAATTQDSKKLLIYDFNTGSSTGRLTRSTRRNGLTG